jgi:hypothetical protein
MYGITETTVHVTYRPLTRDDLDCGSVIGEPIPDLQVYLLDGNLEPVPVGVPGEIFVGGDGVARGYLNRPDLNAERFLDDPFRPGSGSRLYRSGDLARRLRNGDLEYIGRADHQVQLRGFRIEAGEVESVLLQYPNFKDAKVIVREDVPGDQRLVAYVMTDGGQETAFADVRRFAARKLPDYMLPSAVVYLDAFPLTPNGKLDTKALPAPEVSRVQVEASFAAARSDIEAAVCNVWKQVLQVDEVGIHDNFFELGGHSLLATQVAHRVQPILGKPVSIRTLFEHPTVAGLIENVAPEPVQAPVGRLDRPAVRVDQAPLSFIQERIWFIEQLEGGHQFHMPLVVRLRGSLDADALEAALKALVHRHDVLRTSFVEEDGQTVQVLHESVEFTLSRGELTEADPDNAEAEINRGGSRISVPAFRSCAPSTLQGPAFTDW